jgi:serine/threonine protein kinase
VLLALTYMHGQNVTHRDLKPDNLMCTGEADDDLNIKLTDFGFATFFDPKAKMKIALGTPYYMAPELVDCKKYD